MKPDRLARSIDIAAAQKRAAQIAGGQLRFDGKWMAGFHFNSALFRIAAVYHRILKIVVGRPTNRDEVPTLRYPGRESLPPMETCGMVQPRRPPGPWPGQCQPARAASDQALGLRGSLAVRLGKLTGCGATRHTRARSSDGIPKVTTDRAHQR
jgi:hypothetical protein